MSSRKNSGVVAAGLALFSMFFGAGDLIWPLILGGSSGSQNFYAMLGLLITGVSLPLLGLISMMLFQGNYKEFFGRLGIVPALLLIFIVQAILGPIGTIPRLFTLSFATIKPYIPFDVSLALFSIFCCLIVFAFTVRPQNVIKILGLVLTPVLLLSLTAILILGLWSPPEPMHVDISNGQAFKNGLSVGYNTLDLIASFIFAPLVLAHFMQEGDSIDSKESKMLIFKKMTKASLLAAGILSVMYIGLTYVASFYTPQLDSAHLPEERLSAISMHLLGTYGALISCVAVSLACLTTAIPITTIFANYIQNEFFKGQAHPIIPLVITLGISWVMANLGFLGIAKALSPILEVICPGLIMLSIMNIFHKLYEIRTPKIPVFATFAVSAFSYFPLK